MYFYEGEITGDSLFTSLQIKALLNRGPILKERVHS